MKKNDENKPAPVTNKTRQKLKRDIQLEKRSEEAARFYPRLSRRGDTPLARFQGGKGKNVTERNLPFKNVPKEKVTISSKDAAVEGTIPLGKFSVTLGGEYRDVKGTISRPGNKIGIPDTVIKGIQKKVSAGLGYQINPDLKVSGFIDRSRMKGGKGRNIQTVQASGKLMGGNFVGSFSNADGEKVGNFKLVVPFAHGGKLKPRGRKAGY